MRPGFHVGINAVFLEPGMGGLDTYMRELMPELLDAGSGLRFSVFANASGAESLRAQPWATEAAVVTHPLLGRRPARALSELVMLGPLARRQGVDLLHSVGMTAPLARRPVNVVQVPDVIWLTHSDPADRVTAAVWRAVVPPVVRRARRVITLSQASKRELVQRLGLEPGKIDVVSLGPGAEPTAAPTGEAELRRRLELGDGALVLAVAAKRRHKNLTTLIEALPGVLEAVPDARLVLPGRPTPHERELRARARALGVAGAVAFPPFVSAEDLEGLYAAAACFAFPSFVEGFGLPILEAMRRGVPIVCAAASAPAEVAGDAAVFFDPGSSRQAAKAIVALLSDRERAERLADAGRKRAGAFTWRATAQRTLETWERAWDGPLRVASAP
jgi:glycosyltransferase involved in cell wall biosynthesis